MASSTLKSPVDVSVDAFAKFIEKCLPEVAQVIQDFPTPNQQLKYPTITVTHSEKPGFTNEMPYEHCLSGDASKAATTVVWITGQWDYSLQLDIWARSVPERDAVFQRLFNALNAQINPMGLSIKLEDYFGLYGRFEIDGFSHADGEQQSQRGEWRTKVSILASVKQAQIENTYKITKPIVTELDILDTNSDIDA